MIMSNNLYVSQAIDVVEKAKLTNNKDIVENTIDRCIDVLGLTINDDYYC